MLYEKIGGSGSSSSSYKDIDNNSVDYVIGTHVLCSVGGEDKIDDILTEIHRILKPGGKYIFLEHTSVHDKNQFITSLLQRISSPIFNIIGNGCHFRPLWQYMEARTDFHINLNKFQAEMPILMMKPHIDGSLMKL
jgi:ubiquinone/menaquinone biosynthesis C-methylase UbiE